MQINLMEIAGGTWLSGGVCVAWVTLQQLLGVAVENVAKERHKHK